MAKLFSATTDWMHVAAAVVTAPPFAMHAWAKHTALGVQSENIFVLGLTGTGSGDNRYYLHKTSDDQSHATERDTASSQANSSNINDNEWHAYTGNFTSHSSRSISLDGGNTQTVVTTRAASASTDTWVGRSPSGTTTNFVGKLAYLAIWNRVLTNSEIALLAVETPLVAAPSGLVAYYILLADANDSAGANNLTINGTAGFDTDMPTLGQIEPACGLLTAIGWKPVGLTRILKQPVSTQGLLIAQGLAPTIVANMVTVAPGVGAASIAGNVPVAFRAVGPSGAPDVGLIQAVGQIPNLLKYLTVVPDIFTGDADETGLAPLVLTGWYVTPDPAVVTVDGFPPPTILNGSQTVAPGVGYVSIAGLTPTLSLPVGQDGVALALVNPVTAVGQVPDLFTELVVTPDPGLIVAGGFAADTNIDFNWHDAPDPNARSWHSP